MKKIILVLAIAVVFMALPLFAQKLPKPAGYVSDFAGVIDGSSKTQMERIIVAVKEKTGAEIAVVTVETIEPYGSIEEYAIDLASEWGIGKKGEDTGVLILLTIKERLIRIEIGYGLEGAIPDGLAGEIRDKSIVPSLQIGDYGGGLLKGVQAVSGIVAKEYDVDLGSYDVQESRKYTRTGIPGLGYLIFIIIALLFGGGRFLWPLIFLGSMTHRGFYGGGFGSGGSSFRGGFSGFGGGGFGGGGASGSF